ncbi:MAG TPA: spermidine synthase [Lachnospiraceae bacterium]|nr:spermidine synthase [Lachnospiraceae bacterium]
MKLRPVLKNKIYLYMTEFFAGMGVMAVELGASRLLAPYFSSSQIVWTIIIGTIMIAMALGNVYGGRSADKDPDPDRLYKRIIFASVWIAAIPLIGRFIIIGITGILIVAINTNFLIIAAFVSCMIIFVFPLFLLGTVTPSLAKVTMSSMEDSGRTVGYLNAFNTIGSIIGTFLPTFVTIPSVGTAVTFYIFSGILLVLSVVYFLSRAKDDEKDDNDHPQDRKKDIIRISLFSLIFVVFALLGGKASFAFWENGLKYEGESVYNYLQVKENDRSVILSTNVLFGVQSIKIKDDSLTGMYYDYAMAAPILNEKYPAGEHMDILVLGMGTGTYATQCSRYLTDVSFKGVEIDEKITSLAREYFDLDDDIEVITYDGRAYLQASDEKYDVIMVDAYQDITIPFQMSGVEFFSLVKDHLNDGGVMVVNMNMRGTKEGSINDYLQDTIGHVFDTVYTVDVKGSTNRELFAVTDDRDLKKELEDADELLADRPDLQALMERVSDDLVRYESGGLILTDDKAPVELLGMRVIDDIIKDEIAYYREIYKKDGISGLLSEM